MRDLPVAALTTSLIIQVITSMAVYGVPVAAPAAVGELGINPANVGLYTSLLYGVSTVTALACPGFIARFGAVRVGQACLALSAVGLLVAGTGILGLVLVSALVLGVGYGPPSPVAAHILTRQGTGRRANLLFSLKQTGVPGGAALAGLLVPVLVLAFGWRSALMALAALPLISLLLLAPMRRRFDDDRDGRAPLAQGNIFKPLGVLLRQPELRWTGIASGIFAGVQLCLGTFMVIYLVDVIGLDLVSAGIALALLQISGVASRVVMGWIADRFIAPRLLMAALGITTGVLILGIAAFTPDWPLGAIFAVSFVVGITAAGWSGVSYAEAARLAGPEGVAASAGAMTFLMYGGVVIGPSLFTGLIALSGSYTLAYGIIAAITAGGGILMLISPGRRPRTTPLQTEDTP